MNVSTTANNATMHPKHLQVATCGYVVGSIFISFLLYKLVIGIWTAFSAQKGPKVPSLSKKLYGLKDLPCLPFKFPNGQGTEKFFDGRRSAQAWRKIYGPTYSIWSGFKREVILTKPEDVKAFYKDSHTHIKATDNNAGWLFAELLGSCVGLVSKQRWRRVRKPFDCHFTRPVSNTRVKAFHEEATHFLNNLNPTRDDLIVNAANDLKYCPFFIVARIFFGKLDAEQQTELRELGALREHLFRDTFMGGINRYSITKYLPGSAMPRLREFQTRWKTFAKHACTTAAAQSGCAIIPLWESVESGELSMDELLQTLDECLFANLDVTTHAVAWTVLMISQHKDLQEMLFTEILECAGSNTTGEEYEAYIRQDDTLLAACVFESSRLHPILPFSNPEAAKDDKKIDRYIIPKHTDVIVDAYAINVDNPYWDEPFKFDPYRHLGKKDQAQRYNMWRFGFGPRQCLGKHIADIILRIIVAELLRDYVLEIVSGTGDADHNLQEDSWIGLPNSMVKLNPRQYAGRSTGTV